MKKIFTLAALLVLAITVNAQGYRKWDFTNWSSTTIENLQNAAATGGVTGGTWSDTEKANGDNPQVGNCYWSYGSNIDDEGNLTVGDAVIAETEGLVFNTSYTSRRSLAIAVNYPSTNIGTYNGPSYLWFGGKGQTIMTIPAVKGGSTIKIGVESHKSSEARGIQLFAGETELKDAEGNAVAAPKTYTEQTWVVPAGVAYDIVVKNTNGCHIYFIDAEIGEETPEAVYTVVGDLALTGANWDVNATANDMVLDEETGKYEWTNSSIDIVSNTELGFKVVKNRSYEEGQWPYDNNWIIKLGATDELAEGGNYKITIVFNPEGTGSVSVIAERLGDATGINVINADIANGTAVYNMNGQKVQKTQKGLYIVNGRKVVIK